MPFSKGNTLGKANLGRRKDSKKTIWLMESLAENGYDYEKMLTGFLLKAAKGDRLALDMAHLLVKMVPYLANAPKQDVGINQIETLVINRFDAPKAQEHIDTEEVKEPLRSDMNISPSVIPDDEPSTDGQSSDMA